MTETRKRRRDEQALADRIGRLLTDPIPLPLLMALLEVEEKRPGEIWKGFEQFNLSSLAGAFWAAFWTQFQAARRGEPAAPFDLLAYLKATSEKS